MIFSDPISSFFYVLNFALNTVSGVMVTSWAKNIVTFFLNTLYFGECRFPFTAIHVNLNGIIDIA